MRGQQRYLCQGCGLNFTNTPPRGKPLALKAAAVLLYVSGLSMNRTAKLLGVSTPTIQAWLEQFAAAYAQKPEPEGRAVVIELDEMWHDLKKKSEPLWVWKAWDRASGQLVDWECGGRDKATCERLINRLTRWRTRLYCTDDYAVYDVLLPVGQLYAEGGDAWHREGQRAPAALVGAVPAPLHRGLEGQAYGGRPHRPVRSLRRKRQDRRPHIYARLKPSVAGGHRAGLFCVSDSIPFSDQGSRTAGEREPDRG